MGSEVGSSAEDETRSGKFDGNSKDLAPCSRLSSVASSAPVAQRRTWGLCLHFDKCMHSKDAIDDQIQFFLANDAKIAGHSLQMVDSSVSDSWGGWLQREVSCDVLLVNF